MFAKNSSNQGFEEQPFNDDSVFSANPDQTPPFRSDGQNMGVMANNFAGETFSQISSTFEQYLPQNKQASQIEAQANRHARQPTNDELLDYEILNKSSLPSPENYEKRLGSALNNSNNMQNLHHFQSEALSEEPSVLQIMGEYSFDKPTELEDSIIQDTD